MTLKTKITLGSIGLILIGGVFWYRSRATGEVVPTEKVMRGDVVETVSVSGELVPALYTDLSFPSVGVVDDVRVKEGERVVKGTTLASLDRTVLWSELKTARLARTIAEENEKLARRDWNSLKPEERSAKTLATEQAREAVRSLEASMKERVLTAPFDGKISRFNFRVGEIAPLGSVIARIVKNDDFVIEARVPESDIAKITLGMTAKVTFDAFSLDEEFVAEVVEIEPAATVVQDVVSYIVRFHLRAPDARLREGMTADIDIETAKRENVLTLQFRALSKENGREYVEVKSGEDTWQRVEVVTGLEGDEGVIEIVSGLKEGDEVTIGARQKK